MLALFINTFVREYRNKFLHFVTIITFVLIFIFHAVQMNFSFNQETQSTQMMTPQNLMIFFYRAIFFWSTVMSAMVGVQIVRNDIDSKMILQVLSFPITRAQYLLSRVLAAWVIVLGYYFISLLVFGIISLVQNGATGFSWQLFASLGISSLAVLAVIVMGVFSSLFLQKIPAFFLTLFLTILIWVSVGYFSRVDDWSQISWKVMNMIGFFIYALFPHVNVVNEVGLSILHEVSVLPNLWFEIPHLVGSLALWSFITWFFLRRKEL